MRAQNLLHLFLLLIVFSSCRKEEAIINPAENYKQPCTFFPAHPGSWWTYNTSNGGEVTFKIDSVAHRVNSIYLPYFTNLDCYISGCYFYHSAYFGLGQSGYKRAPIILEAISGNIDLKDISTVSFAELYVNEFVAGGATSIKHRRNLYAKDTTITNLNGHNFEDVLIMKEFSIMDTTHYYLEYFAKNIGLVKRDSVNTSDTTNLIEIFTLDQYFINN